MIITMKKNIWILIILWIIIWWWYTQWAQSQEIFNKIIDNVWTTDNSREKVVQWYYSIDNIISRAAQFSGNEKKITDLKTVNEKLRTEIERRKNIEQWNTDDFLNLYSGNIQWDKLSTLCQKNYQIADDWSYAFDLPTALTIAVWDMESSCRLMNPNAHGIFQIIANSYPTWQVLTLGHAIEQFYDFKTFAYNKIISHNNRSSIKNNAISCSSKSWIETGQIAPMCFTYKMLDIDSIVKFWALYNGARYSGNILLPSNTNSYNYIYGKFWTENQSINKEWLIIRILKTLDYNNNITK